jgi:hypothetical protein
VWVGPWIGLNQSIVPQTPGDFEFQSTAHLIFTSDHAWLRAS